MRRAVGQKTTESPLTPEHLDQISYRLNAPAYCAATWTAILRN